MSSSFQWGSQLPRLEGERVFLRAMTPEDAPAVLAIFGDPEVMRYWSSPAMPGIAAALDLVLETQQLFASRELFQWGVCRRDGGDLIGTCTLYKLDSPNRRGEIGFALNRRVWGQGLAKEAVEVLLRFCFETLELHRLEADVDPENAASLGLLEGLGFCREGLLRERWFHLGELRDTVLLGLLRPEWPGVDDC